jgi:hypothetical protein
MANNEHLEILNQGIVAWNKWRENNSEVLPDLRGTDLQGRKLSGANLSGANLSDANMQEANLIGANFSGANLQKASLLQADMFFAYLQRANLRGANLRDSLLSQSGLLNTNLMSADLSGADLSAADLKEAFFSETILGNTNLTNAKNLVSIIHRGPSTIDHRTIEISGNLPIEFLRGCGLSDWQIELGRLSNPNLATGKVTEILNDIAILWSAHPVQYHSYFIRFSHDDEIFARKLHGELQRRGIRVWLDEKPLLPEDEPYEQLDGRVRLRDRVLLCCSKSSLTGWWADNEINLALEKEQKLMKRRNQKVLALIPLDLDGFVHSEEWKSAKKEIMLSRLLIDFRNTDNDEDKFDGQLKIVILTLRTEEGAAAKQLQPSV